MELPIDPNISTLQGEADSTPPLVGTICYVCHRTGEEGREFQRCARCKSVSYCSRECQKKDWPAHKPLCSVVDVQRNFMLKWVPRLDADPKFSECLQMDLVESFFNSFSENPRKMWIILVNFGIYPVSHEDFKALDSKDIPMSTLLDKPIVGQLMIFNFEDVSDQTGLPHLNIIRDTWQRVRDNLDRSKYQDCIAIAVVYAYLGAKVCVVVRDMHPMVHIEESDRQAMKRRLFPKRRIDQWLREMRDSKGRPIYCLMGERDKKSSDHFNG
ncbi:hypothetical protein GALMADRAFT_245853 [Galerina marginata CBS 339.88]|uniref:MYND-type domain-containing protein n=1 Tax=Galerina marginata (strain CBS 339.88) TaxID=685588 RepID=A0A067TFI1_GALM3|nr:hypothetical protein GALMADRAFT_245853 [Galerina marginata CBS 339.88]